MLNIRRVLIDDVTLKLMVRYYTDLNDDLRIVSIEDLQTNKQLNIESEPKVFKYASDAVRKHMRAHSLFKFKTKHNL